RSRRLCARSSAARSARRELVFVETGSRRTVDLFRDRERESPAQGLPRRPRALRRARCTRAGGIRSAARRAALVGWPGLDSALASSEIRRAPARLRRRWTGVLAYLGRLVDP